MPTRLRRPALVLAVAVAALGWSAGAAEARLDGPPRKERVTAVPTVGQRAAKVALRAVGVPYRWGGTSPASGFDCSGLVRWSYGRLGVDLPHSSYALYTLGRRVEPARLKAGDLLFFSGLGHVGLYVGRGRMIHAPQSGRRVEVVALRGPYYGRPIGARRIRG
jgi:cell wall-associated NlpC family hydrolase